MPTSDKGITKSQEFSLSKTPSWKNANLAQKEYYKFQLHEQLVNLKVPPSVKECSDVHCQNQDHKTAVDKFTLTLLEKVQDAAEGCLPISKNSLKKVRKKVRPGWNEEIKPFRDSAYFWHQIWVSCGRPINTEVHNIMKKTPKSLPFPVS